jgi:putative nucleotidyltransferase with HDIG domain
MTVLLNAKKYMALSTPSIRDAMEMIKVHQPDLIIHELELPDGSAEKLIQLARKAQEQSPAFLLLTEEMDQSKLQGVLDLRVTQTILKREFLIKQFYAKVDALLGSNRFGKPLQVKKSSEPSPARPIQSGPKIRTEQDREELYNSIPPLLSEEEVTESINSFADLRAMSPAAAAVMELISNDESTLESIADAIRSDPAIAMKLIRISNSAAFARPEPVTTPLEAVRRLGLEQVRQNIINLEIMENFSDTNAHTIDAVRFWEHSIAVGCASALIARETNAMNPELAYTAGLLHDVGRIILCESLPTDYPEVVQFARENQLALDPIEKRMFGIDHASVMQGVMERWEMSEDLIEPIVHHHKDLSTIELDCPDRVEPVAILSLADRIVHAMGIGCSGNLAIYPTEAYFEALGVGADFLEKISTTLLDEIRSIRGATLGSETLSEPRRVCPGIELHPHYISRHTASDAIRCWTESIANPMNRAKEDCETNIFIVRLRTKRDAIEAEKSIEAHELKHQLSSTPVIVISDSSTLHLSEVVTSAREARLLTTPFTVDEFERSVLSIPELACPEQDEAKAA